METLTEPTVRNTKILESLPSLKIFFFKRNPPALPRAWSVPPNKINLTFSFVTDLDSIKENSGFYRSMGSFNFFRTSHMQEYLTKHSSRTFHLILTLILTL